MEIILECLCEEKCVSVWTWNVKRVVCIYGREVEGVCEGERCLV